MRELKCDKQGVRYTNKNKRGTSEMNLDNKLNFFFVKNWTNYKITLLPIPFI